MVTMLTACMSDLDLKVPASEEKFIIEGWIETGGFAHVMISHSLPYNTTVGQSDLMELLVDEAVVTLTCDGAEERLLLVQDTMYAVIPIFRGYSIRGEAGKSYSLEVRIGDRIFSCTDTLLEPIKPDTFWFSPESSNDSLGYIMMQISDPPALGNYYRIFTKRLGIDIDYNGIAIGVLDDRLFNGHSFSFPLIRTGLETKPDMDFFRKGQRVVIKTCVVTARYFDFLSKVTDEMGKKYSPLSFQSPPASLMTGGALGGWGCYASITDTIEIR